MKRGCFPLRGDHSLLTPDTLIPSGVRLREQVWSEGVLCPFSEAARIGSPVGSTRRRTSASPTRRLRFEDETEMEAESRYLERQRRRAGQQGTAVLVSKPDLNLYMNGMAGLQHRGVVVDRQQRGGTIVRVVGHGDPYGVTALGGTVNMDHDFNVYPPLPDERRWSLNRHRLSLRTEPLRETYIGCVTCTDTNGEGGGANNNSSMKVKRKATQVKQNGAQVNVVPPTIDLPLNPYSFNKEALPLQPSDSPTIKYPNYLPHPAVTSPMMSLDRRLSHTGTDLNQNHEEHVRTANTKSHRELQSGSKQRCPCVEVGDQDTALRKFSSNSSSSSSASSWRSSEMTEDKAPSTSHSSDGLVRQPMRAEAQSDDTSNPEHFSVRDEPARLSLRHLFSTVRLSRTRSGSLDRLILKPCPPIPDHTPTDTRKSCSPLKKSPSVQSLCVGSPVLQLRKSLSVQSFGSELKKKNRSADYKPAADQLLSRCLSVEDISHPRSARSVGRILQVCSDGTFLLELSRPMGQSYGFIISRGKGRLDSGVYVEDMVDTSTEKLYGGLLAVGDEIVEVDGEKVACLSLDHVNELLIQNPSTTVRVLRHLRATPTS
ncbi:uncharacterized protein si:dkey-121a11.3 isoform X2 [Melanotaenia boesemani]|uniref:uncharacterized protein si:dkey-121a11.3 isoform X2 n=1 Tax=Melanotaenia boesemani TaxID=1250792 RepID=UPI001C044C7E|nr:uncharacterized protein si:dkey-121a11.3 isoform X2 [Melanotaenia boesemani]